MTTTPETAAPQLYCPECALPLVYRATIFGGIDPPERWDHAACPAHGLFQYRQRTGRLSRVIAV
jgi:hypothetical protein